jgi:hypothetical protein
MVVMLVVILATQFHDAVSQYASSRIRAAWEQQWPRQDVAVRMTAAVAA